MPGTNMKLLNFQAPQVLVAGWTLTCEFILYVMAGHFMCTDKHFPQSVWENSVWKGCKFWKWSLS